MKSSESATVEFLKELNEPITRENFIELNWDGEPPDPWTVEAEMEVPEELQDWSWLEEKAKK